MPKPSKRQKRAEKTSLAHKKMPHGPVINQLIGLSDAVRGAYPGEVIGNITPQREAHPLGSPAIVASSESPGFDPTDVSAVSLYDPSKQPE